MLVHDFPGAQAAGMRAHLFRGVEGCAAFVLGDPVPVGEPGALGGAARG